MFDASGFLSAGPDKGFIEKNTTDVKNLKWSYLLQTKQRKPVRWRGGKRLGLGLAEGSCNKTVICLGFIGCQGSIPRSGLKLPKLVLPGL